MDITSEFRVIAATHASNTDKPRIKHDHVPDAFLQEAYKLVRIEEDAFK